MNSNAFLDATQITPDDLGHDDGHGAAHVAQMLGAVQQLPYATSRDEAQNLYWCIDNVAVVQGTVYPAGPKLLPALLDSLFTSNAIGRPFLLEVIFQIASGGFAEGAQSVHDQEQQRAAMLHRVQSGHRYFMFLALHGTEEEAQHAIDLLSLTADDARNEEDLQVLLEALQDHFPSRYAVLKRELGG